MYMGFNNNVTLDCEGYSITGDGGDFTDIGIRLVNSNNISVQNCTVDDFYEGIAMIGSASDNVFVNNTFLNSTVGITMDSNSRHHQILNCTATGNSIGFLINGYNTTIRGCNSSRNDQDGFDFSTGADGSTMTDCVAYNNSIYGLNLGNVANITIANSTFSEQHLNFDVWITPYKETDCNHIFENVTGSGNRPIALYNSSISLSGQTFSELILCNADNSDVDSVTINGSDLGTNNALIVRLTDNSNFSNVTSIHNNAGIWLSNSSNNNIRNCTIRDSGGNSGISFLSSSNNNTAEDNTMSSNGWGINIENSDDNTIRNNTLASSTHSILVDTAQRTKIYNNTINSPTQAGIELSQLAHLTEIIDNIITSAWSYAIDIGNSENCTITGNTISSSNWIAMYIHTNSAYNIFTDNNMTSGAGTIDISTITNNNFYSTWFGTVYPTKATTDNYGAELNFTAPTSPPSSVSYLRNISKYINITSTNIGAGVYLNISYSDVTIDTTNESNLRMYGHNGTDWELVSGSGVDTTNDVVRANLIQYEAFGLFYNYSQCGNSLVEPGESCDGTNYSSSTCVTEGFASGTLSCYSNCTFNTSNCTAAAAPSSGGGGGGGRATMIVSVATQCATLPTKISITKRYTNTPVGNVNIDAYSGNKKISAAKTDENGSAEITFVNPGEYTLQFSRSAYRSLAKTIEIEECPVPSQTIPSQEEAISDPGQAEPVDEEILLEPEVQEEELDLHILAKKTYWKYWISLLLLFIIILLYSTYRYSKKRKKHRK
jgi:parallel beta-helix repeat protein